MDESGVKQEIYREAQFGTAVYVMDMNLISYGYEFDMYLKSYQCNRWRIKSGLGLKTGNTQSNSYIYVMDMNWI